MRPLGIDAAIILTFKIKAESESVAKLKLSNIDTLLLLEELHDNVVCKIKDSKTGSSCCGPFAARRNASRERPRTKMLRDKNLKTILQTLTLEVFPSVRKVLDNVMSSMQSRSPHGDDEEEEEESEMDVVRSRETKSLRLVFWTKHFAW